MALKQEQLQKSFERLMTNLDLYGLLDLPMLHEFNYPRYN
jgi:hypothetical protein